MPRCATGMRRNTQYRTLLEVGRTRAGRVWVFLVFPIVGGLIAGFAHRALFERTAL